MKAFSKHCHIINASFSMLYLYFCSCIVRSKKQSIYDVKKKSFHK